MIIAEQSATCTCHTFTGHVAGRIALRDGQPCGTVSSAE